MCWWQQCKFIHLFLPQCKFVILYKKGIAILLFVSDLVLCVILVFYNNFIVSSCVQNDVGLSLKWESKQIHIAIKLIKSLS